MVKKEKPSHSVLDHHVFGQGPQQAGDGVVQWQDEEINHGLGWQDVAGGAVSGIVLVVLLVGLVFWVRLRRDKVENQVEVGVADVCFFLTMRCFNDAMFSNS